MNSDPKRCSQDFGHVPAAWLLRASLALDSGLSHATGRGQGKRLCTEHAGKLSQDQEESLLLPISNTRQLTAQVWAQNSWSTLGTEELPGLVLGDSSPQGQCGPAVTGPALPALGIFLAGPQLFRPKRPLQRSWLLSWQDPLGHRHLWSL